ncbi:MAG: ribonuclease J [Firmicutes bacterium]|nr:ribonuclease J [Bacillota bacterium]
MFVIQYNQEIIVIDAGLKFPEDEMLGVDMVIPDITYLVENKSKIKAIILTHGHEDHIGALPYVLPHINVPIYGTRLTLGLLKIKLEEFGLLKQASLHEIHGGDNITIGSINVSFFSTNHSIPDSVGVILRTPAGNIVYTSDFKFDHTPVLGNITQFDLLADVGREGVLVALSDSTNAEREGYTHSEKEVGETLNDIFLSAEGRIIIVSFASNVHRIQQIVNAASFAGRKIAVDGWSMVNVVEIARELGYLHIPPELMIDVDDVKKFPREKIVVLTTGTQGEPLSALARLANANHRKLEIIPGDTVVIAATPIPGNEKLVHRTIDNLFRRGAKVIYGGVSGVHVSGHGSREELKLMLNMLRPKYLIPVHGEYRHLIHHAALAETIGIPKDNIFIVENGAVMEFSPSQGKVVSSVQAGAVFIDGLGIGDVGNIVLRDRKVLSEDGIFIVVMAIDSKEKELLSGPDIVSRGFVYVKESEELLDEAREIVSSVITNLLSKKVSNWQVIKNSIKESMGKFLWEKTGRKPMILPIIMEI